MTPPARTQAAIDILDSVIAAARDNGPPADRIAQDYFRARRYAGSKDRRAVRDLVYETIRAVGDPPESGRAALLGARPDLRNHFTGEGHAPVPLTADDSAATTGLAPQWLLDKLGPLARPELLDRAPLDLRVNILKAKREDLLHLGEPIEGFPDALTNAPADIASRAEYRDGLVEIQDRGSQRIAAEAAVRPGMTVVDLCAGAGGKTLALAAAMRNQGCLIAADTDKRRLGNLPARAERAGATIIETLLLDPGREMEALGDLRGGADVVLIDAPCSGSGTWRRNPETRWRLTPKRLAALVELQTRLLGIGAQLVKPGGALVYAVCSLLRGESQKQADAFAAQDFAETMRTQLTPWEHGSDGFFIARFEKAC